LPLSNILYNVKTESLNSSVAHILLVKGNMWNNANLGGRLWEMMGNLIQTVFTGSWREGIYKRFTLCEFLPMPLCFKRVKSLNEPVN